jgi:hypothetical protein
LRTTGYLVAFKPQSGGSGEGTNCHLNAPSDTDTHMALVEGVGDAEKSSVVIEFTPRFLKAHPNWKKSALTPWINSDNPVRISGWLMLDPDHRNHLNRFRSTLWEIHPITRIEVWKENQWVDVDGAKWLVARFAARRCLGIANKPSGPFCCIPEARFWMVSDSPIQ